MPAGKIVVGVDGSEESRAALRWALEEARARNADLVVLHAWWGIPELESDPRPHDEDWDTLCRTKSNEFVEGFVEHAIGATKGTVTVTTVAVQGVTAAAALIDTARDADLLVVGSRGLGGFRGLVLGSVSHQCAQHATCPVAIVRA